MSHGPREEHLSLHRSSDQRSILLLLFETIAVLGFLVVTLFHLRKLCLHFSDQREGMKISVTYR